MHKIARKGWAAIFIADQERKMIKAMIMHIHFEGGKGESECMVCHHF
jgi:hypothetical protein